MLKESFKLGLKLKQITILLYLLLPIISMKFIFSIIPPYSAVIDKAVDILQFLKVLFLAVILLPTNVIIGYTVILLVIFSKWLFSKVMFRYRFGFTNFVIRRSDYLLNVTLINVFLFHVT